MTRVGRIPCGIPWAGYACLAVTALGWGPNWPALKLLLLLREFSPLFARGVAGVAAAGLLAGLVQARGQRLGVPRAAGWATLAYMTLVPMALCYLTWFASLRLVPLVGVVSAGLALGEPLGWREAAAMALTLSGVALTVQRG